MVYHRYEFPGNYRRIDIYLQLWRTIEIIFNYDSPHYIYIDIQTFGKIIIG